MTVAATSLELLARRAAVELEGKPAAEIVRWAVDTFGDRFCVTSSMADAVMVDLVSRVAPDVAVVFLDTGYHFAETLGTRDAVAATYTVRLLTITPKKTVAEQDAEYGPRLHERDPDLCCRLRKVDPLDEALAPFDAWASGLRRDEAETRRDTPVVDWDAKRGKVKVNPIAAWTEAEVAAYAERNGVLFNPLLSDGYASIGCAPCTRRVAEGEDARSGRWAGLSMTECGLHT